MLKFNLHDVLAVDFRHPNSLDFIKIVIGLMVCFFVVRAFVLLVATGRPYKVRKTAASATPDNDPGVKLLKLDELPAFHRAIMIRFILSVFGYGYDNREMTSVKEAVTKFPEYIRLVRIIERTLEDLGLTLGNYDTHVDDLDKLSATLLHDNTFTMACVYAADFLGHCVDTAHNLTMPNGRPISEGDIPRDYVVDAYRAVHRELTVGS